MAEGGLAGIMGNKPKPPDGTEGIASVTLKGREDDVIRGCVIHNDQQLMKFINDENYKSRFKTFFVYFYSEGEIEGNVQEAGISIHRFTNPKKPKRDTVQFEDVKIVDKHVFLPLSFKYKYKGFLSKHSKKVSLDHPSPSDIDQGYKGVTSDGKWVKGNEDNRVDGPLLSGDKLIGWYSKKKRNPILFSAQDKKKDSPKESQSKSKSKSNGENVNNAENSSQESSGDMVTQTGPETAKSLLSDRQLEIQEPSRDEASNNHGNIDVQMNQLQLEDGQTETQPQANISVQPMQHTNQPQAREGLDISRRNTPVETSYVFPPDEEEGLPGTGYIPRGREQVKLSQLCQKDHSVIPRASNIFDDKSRGKRHLSSVLSLADRLQAPPLIVSKCSSNYDHNPALEVFKNPSVSMLSLDSLCCTLAKIHRSDVVKLIRLQFEEKDLKFKTVSILLSENEYQDLLDQVTAKLNESPNHFNWRYLGTELKIEDHVLDGIEHGTNPTERFLVDYAYCAVDPRELRLNRFYEHMKELGREDEISELFRKYELTKDDKQHMKKVFAANTPPMEDLSTLLNRENCKNWQHLAVRLGVPSEDYFPFIPDKAVSPTGILLNWLIAAKPDFTVSELVEHLRALKRFDVSEVFETAAIALNNSK